MKAHRCSSPVQAVMGVVLDGKISKSSSSSESKQLLMYLDKLQHLVPRCPKDRPVPKLELIQCVIDYIYDLEDVLAQTEDEDEFEDEVKVEDDVKVHLEDETKVHLEDDVDPEFEDEVKAENDVKDGVELAFEANLEDEVDLEFKVNLEDEPQVTSANDDTQNSGGPNLLE
ncbi:uncharacterized protein LOC143041363 [Oratosquilla oratoria]|uniref:uncharacterized protein LOC143041363 n=1 Tax=Oratosquilla oratoria TaxID=337810 RepID=UPI003F768E7F